LVITLLPIDLVFLGFDFRQALVRIDVLGNYHLVRDGAVLRA
jgi:hypothetical protein